MGGYINGGYINESGEFVRGADAPERELLVEDLEKLSNFMKKLDVTYQEHQDLISRLPRELRDSWYNLQNGLSELHNNLSYKKIANEE